jgi:hypothetical protein
MCTSKFTPVVFSEQALSIVYCMHKLPVFILATASHILPEPTSQETPDSACFNRGRIGIGKKHHFYPLDCLNRQNLSSMFFSNHFCEPCLYSNNVHEGGAGRLVYIGHAAPFGVLHPNNALASPIL